MTTLYRVADFARLAGVTVRALQYYDRIGLLTPSDTTDGGHRLYLHSDLLRLQQILTLKWMGFKLDQIKTILNSPTYNLHQSLAIQKAAVDEQITRLQQASAALERALMDTEETGTGALDSDTVSAIIRGVAPMDDSDFWRRYYSDSAWAGIQLRARTITPQQIEGWAQDWQNIYADFDGLRDQPVESPAVQAVAERMHTLIEGFTAGDPQAEAGLRRFGTDALKGNLPEGYNPKYAPFYGVDDDLRRFVRAAYEHYQQHARGDSRV